MNGWWPSRPAVAERHAPAAGVAGPVVAGAVEGPARLALIVGHAGWVDHASATATQAEHCSNIIAKPPTATRGGRGRSKYGSCSCGYIGLLDTGVWNPSVGDHQSHLDLRGSAPAGRRLAEESQGCCGCCGGWGRGRGAGGRAAAAAATVVEVCCGRGLWLVLLFQGGGRRGVGRARLPPLVLLS